MDLGLALLSVLSKGEPLTCEDIAAWCDCRKSYIHAVEKRALAKLRRALADHWGE